MNDPPTGISTEEVSMDPNSTPDPTAFTTGVEPIGAIDSPTSLDRYRVVLREGTQSLHLQQALITFELTILTPGGLRRHLQLGQVRGLELRNHHHETPLFRAFLRTHLEVPGLSGRADDRVADVYPVDAVVLDAEGSPIEKTSVLSILPATGTHVRMASDADVRKFLGFSARGLLRVGYLARPTHLPLALPHAGQGEEGVSEARHFGCFGPSGSGKTTLLAHLMTGWARHKQMGMFVLDHDGDLSAMEVGRDADGEPHFSLARAFKAVGRDPADVIRVSRNQLRIEAPRDLAAALRIEDFLERLGVGAGEKRHACERAVAEVLGDLLKDVGSFADLDYDTTIADICQACADTYASSQRQTKYREFLDTAKGGGRAEARLRDIWARVQGYASQPASMRELVEAALFDGKVVIVNLAGADSGYDGLMTKRLVQTLLDVAHLSYVLRHEGGAPETWRGRYLRYRPFFDRYRKRQANAIAVIDEAHMVASEEEAREEGTVAHQLAVAIRRTRKFGLAFCFATQEIGTLARSIYNNLSTYVFAYGLKTSSEAERVREVLSDESAFKLYMGLPEPKSSGRYTFMVKGAAVPLANGAPIPLLAYSTQEEFFAANERLTDPGPTAVPPPPPIRPATAPPASGVETLLR